jgi:hypothetical protein
MGTQLCAVSKFGNPTRTHGTCFGNTMGLPAPVAIPTGDWEDKLKVLEKSDVHALNERELNREEQDEQYWLHQRLGIVIDDIQDERVVVQVAAVGEGQRRPLWIWFTDGGTAESMDDPLTCQGMLWYAHTSVLILTHYSALCVEWSKAKARVECWEEEVILLDEEMQCILQYFNWKVKWWRDQKNLHTPDAILSEGLKAFSKQQAAQELDIARDREGKWRAVRARTQPIINGIPDSYYEEEHLGPCKTIEIDLEDEGYDSGTDNN